MEQREAAGRWIEMLYFAFKVHCSSVRDPMPLDGHLLPRQSGPPFCRDSRADEAPFKLEAELAKEINRPSKVVDDDPTLSIRLSAMCPIYKVSSNLTTNLFWQR